MKLKNASIGNLWPFHKERKTIKISDNECDVLLCCKSPRRENIILALVAILLVMVIHLSAAAVLAQEKPPVKDLQPGQKVPEVSITNIINYKSSTAKLSDFKGKLLILDFWATWCKGCLESIPESAGLQKQFGDQLQILYLTSQNSATVAAFLDSHTKIAALKPSIVTGDTVLSRLFPHRLLPHVVWISQDGKYLQASSSIDVTAATIQALLQNQKVSFKDKKQDVLNFDYQKALFDYGNGGNPAYMCRSLIGPYRDGLPVQAGIQRSDTSFRFYGLNMSLLYLFKKALKLPENGWPNSRVLYENLDGSRFIMRNWQEERQQKSFCYELILPRGREKDFHDFMLQDLGRFFNIKASVQRRETGCYVLCRIESARVPLSSGGIMADNLRSPALEPKFMQNSWILSLTSHLNQIPGMLPVFDETEINEKVDLQLGKDLSSVASLNTALQPYGLVLKFETRPIDMLVLTKAGTVASITSKP